MAGSARWCARNHLVGFVFFFYIERNLSLSLPDGEGPMMVPVMATARDHTNLGNNGTEHLH